MQHPSTEKEPPKLPLRNSLEMTMFAAWCNVPVESLPHQYRFHTCDDTMKAWGRVAEAARRYIWGGER